MMKLETKVGCFVGCGSLHSQQVIFLKLRLVYITNKISYCHCHSSQNVLKSLWIYGDYKQEFRTWCSNTFGHLVQLSNLPHFRETIETIACTFTIVQSIFKVWSSKLRHTGKVAKKARTTDRGIRKMIKI